MKTERAWRWGLLAPALVAGIVVLISAAWSGAYAASILVDPGTVVVRGLPLVRTGMNLASALALGSLMLAGFVLPLAKPRSMGERKSARGGNQAASGKKKTGDQYPPSAGATPQTAAFRTATITAAVAAGVWTLLACLRLLFEYSFISGTPITDDAFGPQLGSFVSGIPLGQILLATVLLAAITTTAALLATNPVWSVVATVPILVAYAMQALTGHASGQANHELAMSGMFIHLVGAALWIGGLATLALARRALIEAGQLRIALQRYSSIAAWCLVLVGVSGVASAVVRMAEFSDFGTKYGILVLAKTVLLAGLGLLGLAHRRFIINKFPMPQPPTPALRAQLQRLLWRLVLVELLVMGAVSGVAVALGGTAPPVPNEPWAAPTPAQRITGRDLPPAPDVVNWLVQFRVELLSAVAATAGLVVYWRWVRRLRRRGDEWPIWRAIMWTLGLLTFAWVTCGGPAAYGLVLFSAHMVQHMTLAMIIPLFLVLSAPVTLALRALPVRDDGSRGPREWLLGLLHSRWGQFFAHPVVAALNFAGSMVLFYFTPAFGFALSNHVGHILMIVHFSLAGYLFANALIGVDPGPARIPYPQRLLLLFATMAFHAFFGMSLVESKQLLVAEWFGLLGRPWGPTALADQKIGGAITWGIGEVPTLILAVVVAVMWSRSDERTARQRDRRVDEYGDAELEAYNARLRQLARDERD